MADTYTMWTGVLGSFPTNPEFIEEPEMMAQPYPVSLWRTETGTNYDYPFIPLIPGLETLEIDFQKQRDYICVYDMSAEKEDFLTNGLAILCPTQASIHEVINGEWTLTLVHPIDPYGKWQYIRESNIIKCQGQLFTVKRCEWSFSTQNTGTVTATCEHIFYQLCDMWIFGYNSNVAKFPYCKSAMNSIMSRAVTYDEGTMYRYDFEWDSNWTFLSPWTLAVRASGCTPVEMLLGSGGIIDIKGGELYRDNFYFSINERMENAQDKAFDIRIGMNMAGIKRTVDTSDLALWFRLEDERTKSWFAISYSGLAFPLFQFPHNVVRSDTITYEDWVYEGVEEGTVNLFDLLGPDCIAKWKNSSLPILCYEVDIKDVKNNPDFEGLETYRYKVGDQGRIYDERFGGAVTLKITETETDGITGEVTRVVFGSKNSFTRSAGYPQTIIESPSGQEAVFRLHDSSRKKLSDKNGKKIMRRVVL